jgi:hypothetical protein
MIVCRAVSNGERRVRGAAVDFDRDFTMVWQRRAATSLLFMSQAALGRGGRNVL